VAIRDVWSPDDCPLDLLPWLAWGLSLDNWSTDWPESIKRERVRKAIAIARRKGTAGSVRSVVASFGGSVAIREWWQSEPRGLPHTFSLILNLDSAGAPASAAFVDQVIAEVNRAKPAPWPICVPATGLSAGKAVVAPATLARDEVLAVVRRRRNALRPPATGRRPPTARSPPPTAAPGRNTVRPCGPSRNHHRPGQHRLAGRPTQKDPA
jgi:phage tail P2-like protein